MATIDPTPIKGAAGLVKSHSITQDSETTVMRSGKDILATAGAIASIDNGCDAASRKSVMKGVFGTRAKSTSFRSTIDEDKNA